MSKLRKRVAGRYRWTLPFVLAASITAGGVLVTGAASAPDADETVVYVVARSGSMGAPAGACGSRLACAKAAIAEANAGSTATWTGLAIANPAGPIRDVDLGTKGLQFLVSPDHDGNVNGRADVTDAAYRLSVGGATCYACGLDAAGTIAGTASSASTVVVFIADRPNQVGPGVAALAGRFGPETVIKAIAVGPRATCGPQRVKVGRGGKTEVWVGSLAPVAALTAGGTCTHTSDFGSLSDAIQSAIS